MLIRSISQIASLVMVFFMVGIPTFFVTRKYGRDWKRAIILILYPLGILVPIMSFLHGDQFHVGEIIGSTLALIIMGGITGYFVFRQKKKVITER